MTSHMTGLAFDVILIIGLIGLALEAVMGHTLFRSMVMFIVFSFTMALAWARLAAPDLALAEAAIGAGITGALVMMTYQSLLKENPAARPRPRGNARLSAPIAILAGGLVTAVGWSALGLGEAAGIGGRQAVDSLAQTGVDNPVTAVLVVFRGYDTLLELGVLLAALLSARAVALEDPLDTVTPASGDISVVANLQAVIVPFALVVAVYLLQSGTTNPGGAFQAGAVLAASAVLLMLSGQLRPHHRAGFLTRAATVACLVIFIITGYAMHWWGEGMLALPGTGAVYLIETSMAISVAVILARLVAGARGLRWKSK
ncbi:MAG: hydrogenase subunit MbhD domain-containing protein [Wenzhouxiangellaceae bacterium]|nr:hydrogenase subunit MbhD domain-containing protein [Wenzhouxiangellaceae bacterium]